MLQFGASFLSKLNHIFLEGSFIFALPISVISIKKKASDENSKEMVTYFGIDSTNSESKSIAAKYDIIPPYTKTDNEPVAHPSESLIYMIKGKLRFYATKNDGSNYSFDIAAGDFIHVPAGEPHYAENQSGQAAEAIVTIPSPKFVN